MADATISTLLNNNAREIQAAWARDLAAALPTGRGRISAADLEQQTAEFLQLLTSGTANAKGTDIADAAYKPLREFLESISRSRAMQGYNSDEIASFIFSFKNLEITSIS